MPRCCTCPPTRESGTPQVSRQASGLRKAYWSDCWYLLVVPSWRGRGDLRGSLHEINQDLIRPPMSLLTQTVAIFESTGLVGVASSGYMSIKPLVMSDSDCDDIGMGAATITPKPQHC